VGKRRTGIAGRGAAGGGTGAGNKDFFVGFEVSGVGVEGRAERGREREGGKRGSESVEEYKGRIMDTPLIKYLTQILLK
jgi:hypothetical protein